MDLKGLVEIALAKAPQIVGASLLAAIAGSWLSAPHWPFYLLAPALLLLAVAVWARRGLARQMMTKEQLGFRRNRDWLRFEMLGKMPRGYYALPFVALLGVVLTGLRFPYAAVAFAAVALAAAWGEDRLRYPSERTDEE